MQHVAVLALVARTRVIHGDGATDLQCAHQDGVFFFMEQRFIGTEQGVDLACRYVYAPLPQLLQQQRLCHMAVVVLVQDVAAQLGVKVMALYRGGQLSCEIDALTGAPGLQSVTGVVGFDDQPLHHHVPVAFKPRIAGNQCRGDHTLLMNLQVCGLAALGGPGAFVFYAVL